MRFKDFSLPLRGGGLAIVSMILLNERIRMTTRLSNTLFTAFFVLSVSTTFAADNFNPRRVVKPFAPITKFPVLSAKNAAGTIEDAELVLGIEINGKARAYPINMLTGPRREILNDTLAGQPIAATW